jgi:hypothetical protein
LRLLRIGPNGDASEIELGDFSSGWYGYDCDWQGSGAQYSATATVPTLITNADKGVLASYSVTTSTSSSAATLTYYLATTSGTGVSIAQMSVPDQQAPVQPVLQRADGSYIGTVTTSTSSPMIAFTSSGSTLWMGPNDTPQIATADGGVIGASGTTYDQNGNVTGQKSALTPNPSQSTVGQWPGWLANLLHQSYSAVSGTATALAFAPIIYAPSYSAQPGGNSSTQGTAIQQVQTNQTQGYSKQLPDLSPPVFCYPIPTAGLTPTCGNINAIELLTSKSPAYIFQHYIQTFAPVADDPNTTAKRNSVMYFDDPSNPAAPINVTTPGQILKISLEGFNAKLQTPFFIMAERVDPADNITSVVTLQGHPLAGWRYWRVYSIGTNDVIIETAAYDQPGPGTKNYLGYYVAKGDISSGWQQYLQFIQGALGAPQGSNLSHGTLGGIPLRQYDWPDGPLLNGYWDYAGDFTEYILNNVCQASSCN